MFKRQVLYRSLACCLLSLYVIQPQLASAKPTKAKPTVPQWVPDKALLPQLGTLTTVGKFQIRPPKGYTAGTQGGPGGTQIFYWLSSPRADGVRSYLMLSIVDISPTEVGSISQEKVLDRFLQSIQRQRGQDWKRTPTQRGTIDGIPFVRARWSGSSRENGAMMHGFNYVTIINGKVIQLSSQDVAPQHVAPLKLAEASALTFKLAKNR